jgi:hypothetical protein
VPSSHRDLSLESKRILQYIIDGYRLNNLLNITTEELCNPTIDYKGQTRKTSKLIIQTITKELKSRKDAGNINDLELIRAIGEVSNQLSFVGKEWTQQVSGEYQVTLSTLCKDFCALGHHMVDRSSCFRQGKTRQMDKFILSQSDNTFVLLVKQIVDGKVQRRLHFRGWGFIKANDAGNGFGLAFTNMYPAGVKHQNFITDKVSEMIVGYSRPVTDRGIWANQVFVNGGGIVYCPPVERGDFTLSCRNNWLQTVLCIKCAAVCDYHALDLAVCDYGHACRQCVLGLHECGLCNNFTTNDNKNKIWTPRHDGVDDILICRPCINRIPWCGICNIGWVYQKEFSEECPSCVRRRSSEHDTAPHTP